MVDGADLYSYLIIFGIFVRDLAETPKLEVFAPPRLQGKGHSGECNSLLHVKQADEWPARGRVERIFGSETAREGKGRRGLSRFSRVHNPFPF